MLKYTSSYKEKDGTVSVAFADTQTGETTQAVSFYRDHSGFRFSFGFRTINEAHDLLTAIVRDREQIKAESGFDILRVL